MRFTSGIVALALAGLGSAARPSHREKAGRSLEPTPASLKERSVRASNNMHSFNSSQLSPFAADRLQMCLSSQLSYIESHFER